MFREDFLMRTIRQVAEALARLAGLRKAGELDRALESADSIYEELGLPRGLVDVVDSRSLADMLGRADKIRGLALLLWEEGHIYKAKGDPLTSFGRYRRAHELFLEARARDPHPEDDSAILELSRVVPARHLDPRYRGELDE